MWSHVMDETGEPGEITDIERATTTLPLADTGIELGPQRWQARVLPLRYSSMK